MRRMPIRVILSFIFGFLSATIFYYCSSTYDMTQSQKPTFVFDDDPEEFLIHNHFRKCLRKIIKFPKSNILWHNVVWQSLWAPFMTIYMYNAYFDTRIGNDGKYVVRILTLINSLEPTPIYCQLWFDKSDTPLIVKSNIQMMWQKEIWDSNLYGYSPYLISCPLYGTFSIPTQVSITNKPCEKAMHILNVIHLELKHKKDFAVCVKGMYFPKDDISNRIVEWIELQLLLGASKIFFYVFKLHPNVIKVLEYYKHRDIVDITPLTLASYSYNPSTKERNNENEILQKRQEEMIPLNDCLYRNINSFKYIVVCDIDEVIVPVQHNTWVDMMESLQKVLKRKETKYSGFEIRHTYFMERFSKHPDLNIPQHMFILKNVMRSANFSEVGDFVKSIVDTQGTIIVHNHTPLISFCGYNRFFSVELELAHLHHYRNSCIPSIPLDVCQSTYMDSIINDTLIWRYKDDLIKKTLDSLHEIALS